MEMQNGNRQQTARARSLRTNLTEPERRLWHWLRKETCGAKFRRQHPVGQYILDFYAPKARLAIEVDGDSHYVGARARARDVVRDHVLGTHGIRVLHVTNREVMENVEGVFAMITDVVQERSSQATSPPLAPPPPAAGRGGIVLGLDPGIARLGYGVLMCERGNERAVAFGVIETPKGELGPRLVSLREQLQQLIMLHRPQRIVVEKLFFSKNVKTATAVGEARGVILLTCAEYGVPTVEVSPQDVKQAVAGYGAADKQQVQKMVQALLHLDAIPQPDDAADALAVALAGARVHVQV